MLDGWAIMVTRGTVHMARVQCKAEIKCLSCTEKQEGPTQVTQKHGQEVYMGAQEPNGET